MKCLFIDDPNQYAEMASSANFLAYVYIARNLGQDGVCACALRP